MKKAEPEFTPEETEKRAAEIIRRAFAMPHTPRKAIAPKTTRGAAQRKRRDKGSPKSA